MRSSTLITYLALIVIQVLFGLNYVISKVVITHFPPLVWASVRIAVATLVMFAAALILRRPHPTDGRRFFVPLVGYALLACVINQGSFLVGLRHTTPTNSAVLNTLIPVFTLLIVTLRGQERLTRRRALGFVSAFAGVLVLRKVENLSFTESTALGDLLTVVNCFSYALFLAFAKGFLERHDRIWTTAWMFLYGTVGLTAMAIPDWLSFRMPALTPQLLGCMAFAVIGGTLVTYFLNIWTLARAKSSSVAIFIYLQPIVASALAWSWFGDAPTTRTILSSVLILIGMLLALSPRAPKPAAAGDAAPVPVSGR